MDELLEWLRQQPGVADAQLVQPRAIRLTDEFGQHYFHLFDWDEHDRGSLVAKASGGLATLEASASATRSAIVLSPYGATSDNYPDRSYQADMVAKLRSAGFSIDGGGVNTGRFTLDVLEKLKGHAFIHIQTHGGYLNWNPTDGDDKEVGISLGLKEGELSDDELDAIRADPTLAWGSKGLLFTDDYVTKHFEPGDFEGAWIGIDACHSFESTILADAFLSKGAKVFFGWQDEVYGDWNRQVWSALMSALVAGESLATAFGAAASGFSPRTWDDDCALVFWSCTEHETWFRGLQASERDLYLLPIPDVPEPVNDIITPGELQRMKDLGFKVHPGLDPPPVEGVYFMSPNLLANSTDGSFEMGHQFTDLTFRFRDQTADGSIAVDYVGPKSSASGVGAFISGSGNVFTIYTLTKGTSNFDDGESASFTQVSLYSGEITSDGIVGFQDGFIMADKDDPYEHIIDIGEARLIVDGDEISETVDEFPTGSSGSALTLDEGSGRLPPNGRP